MIDAGQIMAYLDLDSGKFKSGMKSALSAIKDLGNSSLPTSAKLKGLGGAMGQVGRDASALTLAIAAVGTASVAAYAQLDTAARKVSTVADGAIVSLQGIKDGTRELSNELRTMPTDVAAGLYDMISANGDTANAFDYTAIAVKAAKGGFTDTATAVDGLTTVMNAYAMTGVDAMQRVSDQMLIAQNYGKTTFGAIAASIGSVIPLTAQLKTGTDELFASLATLTKQGIGTSEAVTGLKAVYAGILKPTADATKAAKALGLDFSASALRAKGLGGFLDELVAKTGGSADSITNLFGSVEALNAVLALTGEAGRKDFAGAMTAMQSSAGATDAAYQTMVGGIEGSFDAVKVAGINLGSVLAEDFAPKLQGLAEWIAETTEWFSDLPPEIRSTIVTVAGLAAALGPVLIIGGKLVAAFGALSGVMSGPAGWIALGIAGVTALAVGLDKLNVSAEEAQDAFVAKYGQSKEQIEADQKVKTNVKLDVDVTSNAGESVTSAVDKLRGILNSIDVLTDDERNEIVAMIGTDLDPIKAALTAAGLTDGQADAVQAVIDEATQTIREKLSKMEFLDTDTKSKIMTMVGDDHDTLQAELKKLELTPDQIEEVTAAVMIVEGDLRKKLGGMDVLSQTEIDQIIKMIGDDKALLIRQLKTFGLTDAEALTVANAINTATSTLSGGVYSLYDKIYQALTDGKPDTEEQSKALQTDVQTYYDDLISKINLDTETQLKNLKAQLENGFITAEEYQTRADEITAKNGALITSVQQTCTDTLTYVANMSGQSTDAVQKSLTKIEELKQKALEEAEAIAELTAQAESKEGKTAQMLVKSGAKVDQETAQLAFDTAFNQKQVDTYGAEQASKGRQSEINTSYESAYKDKLEKGASPEELKALTAQHDAAIQEELKTLEAQKQQIMDVYNQTLAELATGLTESDPIMKNTIQNALKNVNVYQEISDALSGIMTGTPPTDVASTLSEDAKTLIKQLLNFDIEGFDWSDTAFGKTQMATLLTEAKKNIHDVLVGLINGDANDPLGADQSIVKQIYASLLQGGNLEGVEGATAPEGGDNLSFAKAFVNFFTGGTGSMKVEVPVVPVPKVVTSEETETTSAAAAGSPPPTLSAADIGINEPFKINVPTVFNPVLPEGTNAADEVSAFLDSLLAATPPTSSAQGEGSEARVVDVPVSINPVLPEGTNAADEVSAFLDSLLAATPPTSSAQGEGSEERVVDVPVSINPVLPEGTNAADEVSAFLDSLLATTPPTSSAAEQGGAALKVDVPVDINPVASGSDGQTTTDLVQALIDKITAGAIEKGDVSDEIATALGLTADGLYKSIQQGLNLGDPSGVVDQLIGLRDQLYASAQSAGSAAPQGVADGIVGNQSAAAIAAAGLATAAAGPLAGLLASGISAGVNAIRGLISGAESKRKDLIDTFKSMAKAAYQAAKDELKINSPSKVFDALGVGTVEGYVQGVDRSTKNAQAAMQRMLSVSALSPTQITGANRATQANTVTKTYNTTSRSYNLLGDVHVNDDAQMLEFERRIQRIDRDLSYGVGG